MSIAISGPHSRTEDIMTSMKKLALSACALAFVVPASAATVAVDLSGATTGTTINAVNASFAQGFVPGSLTLAPSGTIDVAPFSPGVSPAGNSLLSQPNNQGPLAMFLAGNVANSITYTAGSASGGSYTVFGYDVAGNLTGSTLVNAGSGYNVFTVNGIGNFAGLLFGANDDPAGLRFMNFSYDTVASGAVPEPATWAMMIFGFGIVGFAMRRRSSSVRVSFA
jgi:PEP-CTERM motif